MPARIAALTGELPRVWTVTLAGPAPPALPAIAVAPLTELPGLAIPIGAAASSSPNGCRQPPHAFLDPIRRRRRERQPDEVAAAAVDEERLARHVDDAVLDRARHHRVGVDERPAASPRGRIRHADRATSGRRRTPVRSAATITSRLCW